MRTYVGILCSSFLCLGGCSSIGPQTITRDRFEYVSAISDSWKRQVLLNLLKIRYADAPVFMDVSSVISSYSLESEVSVYDQYSPPGRGDTTVGAGATGRYTDKPTITYQPLSGDRFAKSLMAPIPVTGILFLIQAGYPADQVMRMCVNRINGLENAYSGPGNPHVGNPKFRDLLTALRESQATGETGFRIRSTKDGPAVVMFMQPASGAAIVSNTRIRELLGLSADGREFSVSYGSYPENDTEISILSRSILQIMVDLSGGIDVPESDVAEGRVYIPQRSTEQGELFPPLLAVHHGSAAPPDAYTSIRYRNEYFWIDDRDQRSKITLSFLMLAFSLTEGAPNQAAPVVTVPAR